MMYGSLVGNFSIFRFGCSTFGSIGAATACAKGPDDIGVIDGVGRRLVLRLNHRKQIRLRFRSKSTQNKPLRRLYSPARAVAWPVVSVALSWTERPSAVPRTRHCSTTAQHRLRRDPARYCRKPQRWYRVVAKTMSRRAVGVEPTPLPIAFELQTDSQPLLSISDRCAQSAHPLASTTELGANSAEYCLLRSRNQETDGSLGCCRSSARPGRMERTQLSRT